MSNNLYALTIISRALFAALAASACDAAEGSAPSDLCAKVAQQAGFPASSMVTAVAIALAESSCDPNKTNKNGSSGDCPNGSTDRGLWQINDCYHPEVNEACAFDAACNAKAALAISSGGTNWSPWAAYNNGAYKHHIDEAQAAVDRLMP